MVRINTLRNDEQALTGRQMAGVMGGKRRRRHCHEVETIVKTQYVPVYTPIFRPVVVPQVPEIRYLPDGTKIYWYP